MARKMAKSNEIISQRLLKMMTMNMKAMVKPCYSSGILNTSAKMKVNFELSTTSLLLSLT